jgi:hypothetical protein
MLTHRPPKPLSAAVQENACSVALQVHRLCAAQFGTVHTVSSANCPSQQHQSTVSADRRGGGSSAVYCCTVRKVTRAQVSLYVLVLVAVRMGHLYSDRAV